MDDTLTEEERVFKNRMLRFLELGFEERDAELLAHASYVDWHEAERLIQRNCSVSLAFEILI